MARILCVLAVAIAALAQAAGFCLSCGHPVSARPMTSFQGAAVAQREAVASGNSLQMMVRGSVPVLVQTATHRQFCDA
jgi:hypothetical protein